MSAYSPQLQNSTEKEVAPTPKSPSPSRPTSPPLQRNPSSLWGIVKRRSLSSSSGKKNRPVSPSPTDKLDAERAKDVAVARRFLSVQEVATICKLCAQFKAQPLETPFSVKEMMNRLGLEVNESEIISLCKKLDPPFVFPLIPTASSKSFHVEKLRSKVYSNQEAKPTSSPSPMSRPALASPGKKTVGFECVADALSLSQFERKPVNLEQDWSEAKKKKEDSGANVEPQDQSPPPKETSLESASSSAPGKNITKNSGSSFVSFLSGEDASFTPESVLSASQFTDLIALYRRKTYPYEQLKKKAASAIQVAEKKCLIVADPSSRMGLNFDFDQVEFLNLFVSLGGNPDKTGFVKVGDLRQALECFVNCGRELFPDPEDHVAKEMYQQYLEVFDAKYLAPIKSHQQQFILKQQQSAAAAMTSPLRRGSSEFSAMMEGRGRSGSFRASSPTSVASLSQLKLSKSSAFSSSSMLASLGPKKEEVLSQKLNFVDFLRCMEYLRSHSFSPDSNANLNSSPAVSGAFSKGSKKMEVSSRQSLFELLDADGSFHQLEDVQHANYIAAPSTNIGSNVLPTLTANGEKGFIVPIQEGTQYGDILLHTSIEHDLLCSPEKLNELMFKERQNEVNYEENSSLLTASISMDLSAAGGGSSPNRRRALAKFRSVAKLLIAMRRSERSLLELHERVISMPEIERCNKRHYARVKRATTPLLAKFLAATPKKLHHMLEPRTTNVLLPSGELIPVGTDLRLLRERTNYVDEPTAANGGRDNNTLRKVWGYPPDCVRRDEEKVKKQIQDLNINIEKELEERVKAIHAAIGENNTASLSSSSLPTHHRKLVERGTLYERMKRKKSQDVGESPSPSGKKSSSLKKKSVDSSAEEERRMKSGPYTTSFATSPNDLVEAIFQIHEDEMKNQRQKSKNDKIHQSFNADRNTASSLSDRELARRRRLHDLNVAKCVHDNVGDDTSKKLKNNHHQLDSSEQPSVTDGSYEFVIFSDFTALVQSKPKNIFSIPHLLQHLSEMVIPIPADHFIDDVHWEDTQGGKRFGVFLPLLHLEELPKRVRIKAIVVPRRRKKVQQSYCSGIDPGKFRPSTASR